jgi:putative ABC transport system permease protein
MPSRLERLVKSAIAWHGAAFVAEYGADMLETFRARASRARRRGRIAFCLFVTRELAALWRGALLQRRVTGLSTEHLSREVRHAARRLLRTPGFSSAAVLTLGLAIGANAAVFTLVQRIAVAPLPYPDADRLIALDHTAPGLGVTAGMGMSIGLYRTYATLPSIEAIALYSEREATIIGGGEAVRAELLQATPSLGDLVGLRPRLGRWFTDADGVQGAPHVVVLSDAMWRQRFAASPAVLGQRLLVDGTPHEVIGVLPAGSSFTDPHVQFVVPLPLPRIWTRAAGFNYQGIARIAPGVTIEEARRAQDAVIAEMPVRYPADPEATAATVGTAKLASLAQPLKRHVLGNTAATLWTLLGAAGVVLLMACANLTNLILVRSDARQREVALRRALGAASTNLLSYALSEAMLIALLGGVLGLVLGYGATALVVQLGPSELPRLHEVRVDATVIGFTALISLAAGLLLGLVPLLRHSLGRAASLVGAERIATAGVAHVTTRNLLMAAQVTLAVVLLSAAGLMVRSFSNLLRVDPGFRADSRLVFGASAPRSEYRTREAAAGFHAEVLERLRALPGVHGVGLTSTLPLSGAGMGDPLEVRNRLMHAADGAPMAAFRRVSHDYFVTMGIPLRRGRGFDAADAAGATSAVIVNDALVARYFGNADPLGQQVRPIEGDQLDRWLTIVGVVGNTATDSLHEPAPVATLYFPLGGSMWADAPSPHEATYVLRVAGSPVEYVPAIRRLLEDLNPRVALARPERLEDVVTRARASRAFAMTLLVLAASVALVVGVVGVYAVVSYGVARREVEIGVRLALGATPVAVTAMIVRQGSRVIVMGVILGVGGALATADLLESLLFGVAPRDLVTHGAVALALLSVAIVACWWPARRAARRNPLDALRAG